MVPTGGVDWKFCADASAAIRLTKHWTEARKCGRRSGSEEGRSAGRVVVVLRVQGFQCSPEASYPRSSPENARLSVAASDFLNCTMYVTSCHELCSAKGCQELGLLNLWAWDVGF